MGNAALGSAVAHHVLLREVRGCVVSGKWRLHRRVGKSKDTDEIINDAYQKELLEATNKSANSQANEIAAIIENNVVENTKKSYVSTINKFIVWLTARKALLETQRRKLENLINARKQKSHVAENVNESGHP